MTLRTLNRRPVGLALVAAAGLLLVLALAWRLFGDAGGRSPLGEVRLRFSTTPAGAPVEATGPVNVDLTLDLRQPPGSGPRFAPTVELQLLDGADQPAPYGEGAAPPAGMHVGGTLTSWTADLAAPTRSGQYHAHLFIRNSGRPDFELDLPQPVLAVVPAVTYPGGLVYTRNGNLWRTDAGGQHTHRLTFYAGDSRAQDPAWSPDGKRIAFSRALPAAASQIPNTEIWALSPDGGPATQLAPRRPDEDLIAPAFAPDGTLYFTSDRVVIPETGATPTIDQLTDAVESWSIEALQPAAPTGTRREVVPNGRTADLSRDGRKMIYVGAQRARAESEQPVTHTLMLAAADGRNPAVLVPDGQFQDLLAPRFSPDGAQVAFAGVNTGDVPGGGLDLLQVLGLAAQPAAANGVPWDIYLVPASGGTPTRLTRLNADQPFPAWSRDGRRLAILTERALYLLDPARPDAPLQQIGPGSSHGQLAWYDP